MKGEVYYKIKYIKKSMLNGRLFSHDEAIRIITKTFSKRIVTKCLAIESNYIWLYRSKKELKKNEDLDEYRVMVIPSIDIYDRKTLCKIRQFILDDKFAYLLHLSVLLENDELIKERVKKNDTEKCIEYFAKGIELLNTLMKTIKHENERDDLINIKHPVFKMIPNYLKFKDAESWVLNSVEADVHFLKIFRNVPMKGNVKFISMMQGRNSILRTAVSKKVHAFRSQILLRPELLPNQVILPYTWAYIFNITNIKIVDFTNMNTIPPDCFYHLGNSFRLLLKRDPAINGASISAHDTIAFVKSDSIFVGIGELENKNADFDGDTETCLIITDPVAIQEIDLNMLPQNNLRIFQQIRISFSEPHILYMHQRKIDENKFKYANLYCSLRNRFSYKWLCQSHNRELIEKIDLKYGKKLYPYVENTREILSKCLDYIIQIDSSKAGFEFYNFINTNILKLANNDSTSDLYDENLPMQYWMKNDILCDEIIRVCMSEARGHLEALYGLTERLFNNDKTTTINEHVNGDLNIHSSFSKFQIVNQEMANKSREVQLNGHNFFKSNIGYDTITLDNENIGYNGVTINHPIELDYNILLPPDLAHLITFVL